MNWEDLIYKLEQVIGLDEYPDVRIAICESGEHVSEQFLNVREIHGVQLQDGIVYIYTVTP